MATDAQRQITPQMVKHAHFARWLAGIEARFAPNPHIQILTPQSATEKSADLGEFPALTAHDLQNGLAIITNTEQTPPRVAIVPPFPFTESGEYSAFQPLRHHWQQPRQVAMLLLRLGHYALGISTDGELKNSKADARYVRGKHKKGGQSSMRFTRNRQHWIKELFDEVTKEFKARIIDQCGKNLDYIFLGGDKIVLKQFLNQADWGADYAARIHPRRLTAPQANKRGLLDAVEEAWSARIWHYQPT